MSRYPNIEAERARLGLTKSTLCKKIGISQKTLWNWQDGRSIPSEKLDALRNLFKCTADHLLESPDEIQRDSA